MEIKKRIEKLTQIYGLSADEGNIANYLKDTLEELGIESYIDGFGNVLGKIQKGFEKTILLEAHMDQIGLMVSEVDEDGYVKFVNLGGVDQRILCQMEVEILSKPPVYGIITPISPNIKNGEEKRCAKIEELRIDTGLENAKSIIKKGMGIVMKNRPVFLENGKVCSAALDNRAGIAAILDSVERLAENQKYNIEILFSTQEELGLHGAYTGVLPNMADAAIAVDVTHGTTPDAKEETNVFDLGCGGVICRGPNLHYEYTKQLIEMSERENIPYEIEVASGGSGTTAWAVQVTGEGIPVMLISIPLRYMHTNVEVLDIADVKAVSDMIYTAVTGGIELD